MGPSAVDYNLTLCRLQHRCHGQLGIGHWATQCQSLAYAYAESTLSPSQGLKDLASGLSSNRV